MRLIALPIAALCLFAAACSRGPQQAAESAAPAPSVAVAEPAPVKPNPFPQWVFLAEQAGGGKVYYQPTTITRAPDGSTGDVWVEILYGNEQTYLIEDKTTRQTITYSRERVLFHFKCEDAQYAILERRLMGAGEEVAESIKTPMKSESDWREPRQGGVTAVTFGPACRAVKP